jgi:putative ABC transport system permease protein
VNPLVTFKIAGRALLRNKLRSFLTTLGVVIGVGAVIAMVAIGEGAKEQVKQTFASMGSNLLILMPGSTSTAGSRGGFGSSSSLTWDDLAAISDELRSTVKYVAPAPSASRPLITQEQNWTTRVTGTVPDFFPLRNWKMSSGSSFSTADLQGATKVVVLGQTVVDNLFQPGEDVIGQSVRISNVPFTIVGVMAKQGQSAGGQDLDDAAFVPVTTYQQKIQGGLQAYVTGVVFIGATSSETTSRAESQIESLLRDRHHLFGNAPDDFNLRNLSEIAAAQEAGTDTMTSLLAAIAAVSLLVGGIGIMNIMLVSVTERTREIGVRMAVGAKRWHILSQFLVEAITLAFIGGLLGVGGGLFVAIKLAKAQQWPILIQPQIIAIAVGFSAAIGIGFGLYPARKASRLDPIEALRYE